ncbi:DNA recombination protein RmuC [Scrofimicrobium sp. R131]|uniref:DNA recombination protein RmuC n=1 Tax=Scrofimicrobium appendicitidis TaxID=3079930 RepID=A0AAU7VBG5_9ACTO
MSLESILLVGVIVLVAVLIVLVLRRGGDGADGGRLTQLVEDTARLEQQIVTSGQMQGQRTVELQQVLDARLRDQVGQNRDEARQRLQADAAARLELQEILTGRLDRMDRSLGELRDSLTKGLDQLRTTNAAELERIRLEVAEKLQASLAQSLKENSEQIEKLTETSSKRQDELRDALRLELDKVRTQNDEQLEKMRLTVDEKLQGTLQKRLGESFQLVSDRLEKVQRGLGEMQTLASDVGGLKRVLSNVKTRGTWGEVQLSRQLEDVLSPSQYEENVAIDPQSRERVEFAVRLPGKSEDSPVYLPIDSKFPQESYERLLSAQEAGDVVEVERATKELEQAIRLQAKTISTKYIHPPLSTDFAIMYLPTEGLFAETVRIPGLASSLQVNERVMITGPTTLMSLLGSLQMGFKTLAIEKRSSEVWQVLGAAKAEFAKYGQVWERLGKQLQTAQRTVEDAGRRTRAVERKLRDVELLEVEGEAEDLIDEVLLIEE